MGRLGFVALGAMLLAFGADCATHSVDFPIYHRIATQILQGNYELYPKALYEGGPVPAHGFRYAPAIAFLFVPFGFLPLEAAAFLFFILKVAAFVYVGAVVARYIGLPTHYRILMLTSLLFVGGYVVEEFRYGNFHFFCVALMVLAFDSAESGSVVTPAAALGVAIAAKLTPVMLLAYFALRRRVAVCISTVIVLVLLGVLPAALVGYDTNNRLIEGFAKYAVEKIDEGDNYALRGALLRYLTPDHRENQTYPKTSLADLSIQAVSEVWILILVAGGFVVGAVLRREPSGPAIRLLEFSVVLTAMLLASPHTQRRYFTALYVPIVALLALTAKYPELPESGPVRVALAMTAAISTALPLVVGGRRLALVYEACSPYFFGTLALLMTLVFVTARFKGRGAPGCDSTDQTLVGTLG